MVLPLEYSLSSFHFPLSSKQPAIIVRQQPQSHDETYILGNNRTQSHTLDLHTKTIDERQVVAASQAYLWWVWLIPAAGCVAFIWDGIFIGVTATRGMLVSSCLSALLFFGVYEITRDAIGNHGLWLAMILYLLMRGVLQTIWYRLRIINGI